MDTLIRTSELPATVRAETWHHVVCDTLGPLEMHVHGDRPPRGEIQIGQLGAIRIARVHTNTPHTVHRTRALIRSDSPELYRVVMPLQGSHFLAQDGNQCRLATGEFSVYDFSRPYDLAYDTAVELVVLSFPRTLLPLSVARAGKAGPFLPAELIAGRIGQDNGPAALLAPMLRTVVTADSMAYSPAVATRLSVVLLDLLAAAFVEAGQLDGSSAIPVESRQRTLLIEIYTFIERQLAEPDLDPEAVGAACHISVRYLHRLFTTENRTVAGWIRQRRLERCRQDLLDPDLRSIPVGDIGARWGLPNPSQFSRLFRNRFGMPPSEFRRQAVR